MSKVCIIIPFYNEAGRVDNAAFGDFLHQHSEFALMLVNDGSSDNTLSLLKKIEEANPEQVRVLELVQNSGKAEAVRQGVLNALQWKDFDIFGYMDADLATPLDEAPYLTSFFQDSAFQMIIGSRVKLYGWNIKRSLKRHYLGRVFATYVSNLFNLDIYDTQCGAKFFRSEITADLFESPFVSKWFFDIELFLRLRKEMGSELFAKSLREMPLRNWEEKGESKLQLGDFLATPFELIRIRNKYR